MWEGWKKYADAGDSKCYELMVGAKAKVLLITCITKVDTEPLSWKVAVIAVAPAAEEHIDFEGVFSNFEEAERTAWEEAQSAVEARRSLLY
jgi:hypothetical protein